MVVCVCVRVYFLQTGRCSLLVPTFWSHLCSMSPLLLGKSRLLKRCSFPLHLTSPNLRVEDLPRLESRWCLLKRAVLRVLDQFPLLAEWHLKFTVKPSPLGLVSHLVPPFWEQAGLGFRCSCTRALVVRGCLDFDSLCIMFFQGSWRCH